nr:putative reverse transcriptase domain-containing protein [Tanacetum cinerariifolium]
MEFEIRDRVMLKVSPWKGVVRFGKRGKLNPRYVGPFKVLAKVGKVAYKLELTQELSRVHHTFHVSNLKKCYSDEPEAEYHWLRFAGTLGGALSSPRNVKIRSRRNTHISSQTGRRHLLQAGTPPRNRPLLATPKPGCEVGESSATAVRRPGPTMAHGTREALARSEAYCRALEARVAVLETHASGLEWQRQAADDFAVQHIMRTQALEAGARDDTLEDTGSTIQIMARTRRGQTPPPTNLNNPNNMTPKAMQTMINQALLRNSGGGDGSYSSHTENPRNMHIARPCYYADFMKCHPLNIKETEGVFGLTRWIEKMEFVFNISGCAVENQFLDEVYFGYALDTYAFVEVYCRISAEGGVTVFGVGKLRSGCAIGLKTTSKVKSGFPGTKVCASGLKHVIVVIVVVPIIDDSLEALNVIYSDVSCTFLVFVVAVL